MSVLTDFVRRNDIPDRFVRGLVMFWLPLVLAAVVAIIAALAADISQDLLSAVGVAATLTASFGIGLGFAYWQSIETHRPNWVGTFGTAAFAIPAAIASPSLPVLFVAAYVVGTIAFNLFLQIQRLQNDSPRPRSRTVGSAKSRSGKSSMPRGSKHRG